MLTKLKEFGTAILYPPITPSVAIVPLAMLVTVVIALLTGYFKYRLDYSNNEITSRVWLQTTHIWSTRLLATTVWILAIISAPHIGGQLVEVQSVLLDFVCALALGAITWGLSTIIHYGAAAYHSAELHEEQAWQETMKNIAPDHRASAVAIALLKYEEAHHLV